MPESPPALPAVANSDVSDATTAHEEGDVVTLQCESCSKQFAIERRMHGRIVACPYCKSQTRISDAHFESQWRQPATPVPKTGESTPALTAAAETASADESLADSDALAVRESMGEYPTRANARPSAVSDSVEDLLPPKATHRPNDAEKTVALSSNDDASAMVVDSTTDAQPPDESAAWLPPRFTGSSQPVDAAEEPHAQSSYRPPWDALDIDTAVTRLTMSDEVVAVRALSREEKDRRKKIRVSIVFGVGVVVLLVVFWLLHSWGT